MKTRLDIMENIAFDNAQWFLSKNKKNHKPVDYSAVKKRNLIPDTPKHKINK